MRSRGLTREPMYYKCKAGPCGSYLRGRRSPMEGHLNHGLRDRKAASSVGFASGQIVLAVLMVSFRV